MLNLSIPRSKSFCRMDFPQAVGLIRNLQIHQNNVSFELIAYGDETAYNMLTGTQQMGVMHEANEGMVFKKYFSTEVAKIDEVAPRVTTAGLTPSELMKECCYEYVKSLANPLD